MVYVEQNTLERVRGEHVWHGPAMLARRDEWTHALPDEAIAELDAAVSRVASEGISLLDISRNTFEMPVQINIEGNKTQPEIQQQQQQQVMVQQKTLG